MLHARGLGWVEYDMCVGAGAGNVTCDPAFGARLNNSTNALLPTGTDACQLRLTYSPVALGIMAPALIPSAALPSASAASACESAAPDLLACMAISWLPADLDVLLLHDCTRPCLEANVTPRSRCLAAAHGGLVHHAPLEHGTAPAWAKPWARQLSRRCFYGPLHGSHNASYGN